MDLQSCSPDVVGRVSGPPEFRRDVGLSRAARCGIAALSLAAWLSTCAGCTSTNTSNTARTAKEQLLISNSVDQALSKVDFQPFRGDALYLEEKYLECVDKNYIIASLRHRALHSGARLVGKAEDADVIVEIRSGGVGTDNSDSFVGVPEVNVPVPLPVSVPEVRLATRSRQTAIAKIGIVAYDARTHQILGEGGVSLARSDDNKWYFLGIGPYERGSVHEEVTKSLALEASPNDLPRVVEFRDEQRSGTSSGPVRLSSGDGGQ